METAPHLHSSEGETAPQLHSSEGETAPQLHSSEGKTALQLHSSEVETAPQLHLLWMWSGPVHGYNVIVTAKIFCANNLYPNYKIEVHAYSIILVPYSQFFLQSVDFTISFSQLLLNFSNPSVRLCLQTQSYQFRKFTNASLFVHFRTLAGITTKLAVSSLLSALAALSVACELQHLSSGPVAGGGTFYGHNHQSMNISTSVPYPQCL